MTATSSNTVKVRCSVCERMSHSCNLVFDFLHMRAFPICEFCRNPLPRKEGTNG